MRATWSEVRFPQNRKCPSPFLPLAQLAHPPCGSGTAPAAAAPPLTVSALPTAPAPVRRAHRSFKLLLCLALLTAGLAANPAAKAQTMARRGWSGGAVDAQPWWQRAAFYRIDPARFQASGTATTGNLPGIALRLDYLESLGVDALVLEPGPGGDNLLHPDALENLIREAGYHHLRILPSLPPTLQHGDRARLLGTVHEWLAEGAAGIAVPPSLEPTPPEAAAYASLVNQLRATPGDRVLLTGPLSTPASPATVPAPPSGHKGYPGARSGLLSLSALLPASPATASILSSALLSLLNTSASRSSLPLLRLTAADAPTGGRPGAANMPPMPAANEIAAAAVLLASPSAALFDFGAEIGLNTAPGGNPSAPLMQWTPTNVRQDAPVEPAETPAPAPGQPTPFGAYKPFVRPPPRSLTGNDPAGPPVALDRNIPPAPPDPGTLPGFTAGLLPIPPVNGATLNVATQERDPRSTLNAFRSLLALRRGNPALREGTLVLLHPDDAGALVFLRRSPQGAPTAAAVIVAANLADTPVVLSLDAELRAQHLRPGPLRALFSDGPQTLTGESTAALRLPPHAVFLGELRSH